MMFRILITCRSCASQRGTLVILPYTTALRPFCRVHSVFAFRHCVSQSKLRLGAQHAL